MPPKLPQTCTYCWCLSVFRVCGVCASGWREQRAVWCALQGSKAPRQQLRSCATSWRSSAPHLQLTSCPSQWHPSSLLDHALQQKGQHQHQQDAHAPGREGRCSLCAALLPSLCAPLAALSPLLACSPALLLAVVLLLLQVLGQAAAVLAALEGAPTGAQLLGGSRGGSCSWRSSGSLLSGQGEKKGGAAGVRGNEVQSQEAR